MKVLYLTFIILLMFNLSILIFHFRNKEKEYLDFINKLSESKKLDKIGKQVFKYNNLYIDKNYIYYKTSKVEHLNNSRYVKAFISAFNI